MPSRRDFLRAAALAVLAPLPLARALGAQGRGHSAGGTKHPEPREGITGAKVLASEGMSERHARAYDAAREFPGVMDGLYCHCNCGERDGMRSLLECFETKMPQTCGICRGEAELAARLAREGKTLAEIRGAVDEKYG